MPIRLARLVVVVLGCIAAVACSDDDDATTGASPALAATDAATTRAAARTVATTVPVTTAPVTTAPAPTTTAPPPTPAAPEAGPFPVGVTTLVLGSGAAVEVWYPAAAPATGTVGYDVRDFVPPAVRELLTADIPAGYQFPGTRDIEVADGRHPLVLFSHGFSGIRTQSSFLTSHLATWGMIVAAPDHASRDLSAVLSGTATDDRAAAVVDLLATLDLLAAEDATPPSRFAERVDLERVAAVGHSAGGFTVLGAGLDPRIDGYVSMASGGLEPGAPYPDAPALFLAGATDAVVPVATATRPAYDAAPAPAWYVELAATGHNGFDDFCTFGGGRGIIGVAEASGLGPLLDAQPQLRTLGLDGCVPPAAPVDQAFPAIRSATTTFLRSVFAEANDPALGPQLQATTPLPVTIEARPR